MMDGIWRGCGAQRRLNLTFTGEEKAAFDQKSRGEKAVMDDYAIFVGWETPIPWLKRWERKPEKKAPEPDPQTRLRNIDYMNMLEELEFK